jgi:Fic family protein
VLLVGEIAANIGFMENQKPDKKADVLANIDRGEPIALLEPLLLAQEVPARPELQDMALEIAVKSAALKSSIPSAIVGALAELVRVMNCYYSNLIEGHNTHPYDIERAQKKDYSNDPEKRNLQLEAESHIAVQKWIDESPDLGIYDPVVIREIHRRFCQLLPDALLVVEDPKSGETVQVTPGEFRRRDVIVGGHVPVSGGAVPRFMERFASAYSGLNRIERVISTPAAHHRLLFIHPFLDGNGRVARLMSYGQLLTAADTSGIWSIARGLARNVDQYKEHLSNCDQKRWNDLDGRGNLSQRALLEFTQFFLRICIDQIEYMQRVIEPAGLHKRVLSWADAERAKGQLLPGAPKLLEAVLYRGQIPRSEIPALLGVGDRQARRVVSALLERGVLFSASDREPVCLSFPVQAASSWFPGLFPPN